MKFSSSFTEKRLCLRFKAQYINALCGYTHSVISRVVLTERDICSRVNFFYLYGRARKLMVHCQNSTFITIGCNALIQETIC